MKKYLFLLIIFFAVLGCDDDDGDGFIDVQCEFINYYPYSGGQFVLGDMADEYIYVAFETGTSDTDIANYISSVSLFDQNYIYSLHTPNQYPYKFTTLKFTSPKSCEVMGLAIDFIEQSNLVAYVSYAIETGDCSDWFGYPMGSLCIDTYSSIFYVEVLDENDLTDLNLMVSQTNTEIIEQLDFMPEWFALRATKQSQGDAIAMANFFYDSGLFSATDPNIMKMVVED